VRAAVLVLVVVAGCHEKAEPTAPPPPLRPEPEAKTVANATKDCDATDPAGERKPLTFDGRSIPEGQRLSEKAYEELKTWSNNELDRGTREDRLSAAVNDFLTALSADPYNVHATYGLAAAYAQIGRKQCSINLLTRLLQMRPHASKHAEVQAHIDHLLGRGQSLDADFNAMRRDERFRELIQKMCEGTNDPNCVYGAQKDGRER
jgi:hypothetical protein